MSSDVPPIRLSLRYESDALAEAAHQAGALAAAQERSPRAEPEAVLAPTAAQFAPQQFAQPKLPGEWIVIRGVAIAPSPASTFATIDLTSLEQPLRRALSQSPAIAWLQRWAVIGDGTLESDWSRDNPWGPTYATFRRRVLLPDRHHSFLDVRAQVAGHAGPTPPMGIWSFADLAISTKLAAEHQAVSKDGFRPMLVPPDKLSDEDIHRAIVASIQTAGVALIAAARDLSLAPEWHWGAHAWAGRGLDHYWRLPVPDPPRQIPSTWAFAESLPVIGERPDLDQASEAWIQRFKATFGMTRT